MAMAWPCLANVRDHATYCMPQFTLMFAFSMPIALLGALADDPRLGLDNSSINSALAAGSLMRALGKLCNGITIDVVGVKPFLNVALLAAAAAAAALSFADGQAKLSLILGALAFCNSGGWLCGCKIIEGRFKKEEWASCFSNLATFSRCGTMAARIGLGSLLAVFGWQSIALGSGPLLLCSWAFVTQVLLKPDDPGRRAHSPRCLVVNPQDADAELAQHAAAMASDRKTGDGAGTSRLVRIKGMLCHRGYQLEAAIIACCSCFMAFENMCPLMLKDLTSLSNAEIGVLATVFPAGVLCGVLTTPRIYSRLPSPFHKLLMELGLQGMAVVSLITLCWLSNMATASPGSVPAWCFLACLSIAAFGLALNYYIKPGTFCLEWGEDCATASSMMDGAGQAACVIFQLVSSSLFAHAGSWSQVLSVAVGLLLLMSLCTVLLYIERQGGVFAQLTGVLSGSKMRVVVPASALLIVLRVVYASFVGLDPAQLVAVSPAASSLTDTAR